MGARNSGGGMMLHFRVHPIAAVTGQSEYDVWYEQFRDWPHFERSLGMDQADLKMAIEDITSFGSTAYDGYAYYAIVHSWELFCNAWILVAVAASPLGDYLTDTQRGVTHHDHTRNSDYQAD